MGSAGWLSGLQEKESKNAEFFEAGDCPTLRKLKNHKLMHKKYVIVPNKYFFSIISLSIRDNGKEISISNYYILFNYLCVFFSQFDSHPI